jgi:hypothetical protein
MLFEQLIRLAASRTFCTAGTSRPTNIAMMAITTSNSISVNPKRLREQAFIEYYPQSSAKPVSMYNNMAKIIRTQL